MDDRPLIAVIGAGDINEDDPIYGLAFELGKALIDNGYRIITGGYGGIMEAASRGGRESDKHSSGDIIGILPSRSREGANPFIDIVIPSGLGLIRNSVIANSDAVIAVGGGAGTLSEMAFAWQFGRLLIAYRVEGWSGELADRQIDGRERAPNVQNDRVYGVDASDEVLLILANHLEDYN
ncbi:MAG: TIGR00725 family protein [Thermoplasmata archaeon]|nr:TIGR00725 family protein [Thermoplasmata archaeon]